MINTLVKFGSELFDSRYPHLGQKSCYPPDSKKQNSGNLQPKVQKRYPNYAERQFLIKPFKWTLSKCMSHLGKKRMQKQIADPYNFHRN